MTGKVLLSFAMSVFSLISADILDLSHSLHFVFIEGCCDITEAHVLSHGDKDWWGISSSLLIAYSGKLVAGFVTVHNSAYLPSRICGPTAQNDLLCLWGPQARLISFCSVYSVGSSTLGLHHISFACPFHPHVESGKQALCYLSFVHFQPCRADATPSLASVLIEWLCSSSPLVTQTFQLIHKRCWGNYLRSYL